MRLTTRFEHDLSSGDSGEGADLTVHPLYFKPSLRNDYPLTPRIQPLDQSGACNPPRILLLLVLRRASCGGVDRAPFTLRRFQPRRSPIGGVGFGEASFAVPSRAERVLPVCPEANSADRASRRVKPPG